MFETDERNVFDGWELEYTAGYVGIQNTVLSNDVLQIYPNPTSGQLQVTSYGLQENVEYSIFSIMGQVVMQGVLPCRDATCPVLTINVELLTKGIYYLRIAEKIIKFVKM